jgi:hypothetical protein
MQGIHNSFELEESEGLGTSSLKLPARGAPSSIAPLWASKYDSSKPTCTGDKKHKGSSPPPKQSGAFSMDCDFPSPPPQFAPPPSFRKPKPEAMITTMMPPAARAALDSPGTVSIGNRKILSVTGSSDRPLLPLIKPWATSIRDTEVKQEAKQPPAALGEKKPGAYSVEPSTSTSGVDTKPGANGGTSSMDTKERTSPPQLQMAAAACQNDSMMFRSGGSKPGAAYTSANQTRTSTSHSLQLEAPQLVSDNDLRDKLAKSSGDKRDFRMARRRMVRRVPQNNIGSGAPPVLSRNCTPGALPIRDGRVHESNSHLEHESTIVAELVPDMTEIEEERDELRHQLEIERQRTELTAVPEAVEVVKEEPNMLSTRNLAVCGLVLVTVIIIAVVVAVTVGGPDPTPVEEPFFDQIGSGLDGDAEVDGEFGSSLSLSGDGATLAVANTNSVIIYRLEEGPADGDADDASDWMPYGPAIMPPGCGGAVVDSVLSESVSFALRSDIVVDLSRHGKTVAIGCPLSSSSVNGTEQENSGRVEIYQETDGAWELSGEPLFGGKAGDFLGASVSLSSSGTTLAVGTPGPEGNVQVFKMEQDEWVPHCESIESSSLLISVGSVSMSADGLVLAVGGMSLAGGDSAVRMYRYISDDWKAMGNGIDGNLEDTAYIANLAGNGRIVAVSNYYVGNAGLAQEKLNDALDARAFEWSENLEEWVIMGENLHGYDPGQKSGYFVTLSDDGLLMGMGDPGRRGEDEGAITGHAHIYGYNGETWVQLGPNKYGEDTGDQFGYSVAFSGDGRSFAVAAPFNRDNGFEHGRVSIFDIDLDGYM